MKLITIPTIIIFILLTSCRHKNTQENKKNTIELTSQESKINTVKEYTSEQFIQNDSLVRIWLIELKKISSSNLNFKINKKDIPNKYDSSTTDTIKTLIYYNSKITMYLGRNIRKIISAEIKNIQLPISNFISIGMNKSKLEILLTTKISSNIIRISNLEQTTCFIFRFKNNKLNIIYFEGYID